MTDSIKQVLAGSGGHTHGDGSGGAHDHDDTPTPGAQSVAEAYAAYAVTEGVTINVVHAGGIVAGVMAMVGTIVAISTCTTGQEEVNAMATEGVFAIANPDGVAFAQGALVGLQMAGQKAIAAGTGDIDGVCWAATDGSGSHVFVKINP